MTHTCKFLYMNRSMQFIKRKILFEILELRIIRCVWKMYTFCILQMSRKMQFYNKTNAWWWRRQLFDLNLIPNSTQFEYQMILFFLCIFVYVLLHYFVVIFHCIFSKDSEMDIIKNSTYTQCARKKRQKNRASSTL